jgi:hypothetical protein
MQAVRLYKNAQDKTTLTIPNRGAEKLGSQRIAGEQFYTDAARPSISH